MVYTGTSIARVFFITAAAFGGLSLYGYTTKRDLSAFGTFLVMGLIGLIIAMVVNIFLQSSTVTWVISLVGVGLFTALTAYDVQRIQSGAIAAQLGSMEKAAVIGALQLYLDFINLFLFMLRLLGGRS